MKTTLTIISLGIILIGCGKKKSPLAKQIPEAINQSQKQPEKPKGKPTAQLLTGEEAFEILKTGLSGITVDEPNKATSFVVDWDIDQTSGTFVSRVPADFPSDKSVAGQDLRRVMFRVERYSETNRAKIVKIYKRLNKIRDASGEIRIAQSKLRYPRQVFVPLPIPTRPEKDQNKTTIYSRVPASPKKKDGGLKGIPSRRPGGLKAVPSRENPKPKNQNKKRPSRRPSPPKKKGGGLKGIPSRQPSGQEATPTRGRTNPENPPTPKNEQKQDPRIRRLDIQISELGNERAGLQEQLKKIPRIPGRLVMYQFPLHIPQKEANETPKPTRWVLGPEIDICTFLFWSDEFGEWIDEWTETNSLPSRLKVELAFKKPDGSEPMLSDILSCEVFSPDAAKSHLAKAEKGDAQAQYSLGMMYSNGNQVKKDFKKAAKWWLKSAEQGNALSQAFLALSYFRGEGVPKDLITGFAWIHIAEINGVADDFYGEDIVIYEKVKSLARKMTDAQKNKAIGMTYGMIHKNPKLMK